MLDPTQVQASNLLLNDLNNSNIDYYFINDKQVTGDGTWSNGTNPRTYTWRDQR